jgi:hypothetical protein
MGSRTVSRVVSLKRRWHGWPNDNDNRHRGWCSPVWEGQHFPEHGGTYPNQAFTAFIPSASAAQFPNPRQYEGRTVSVSGKISLYKGKPEIIVNWPSQISAK